ncbi:diguanylate cyclase/phosphodiesterase [Sulfurimonas denitrificans DSM 1251]|uniref:Diguanylate cyclase/phosphodiesterase n=1 Tax=Sulfurimonas denitrificans (strain ATCC 33889 / DSM 1251) TaxID=326298 RepID=Q30Q13_SULDN|nr:bifunctional diguanylate cyclase/phosphodiesterase [Sulfurimonas denitrificans]ABB44918.1 diguanylate cyclase/phosphodiesterase [Sulfurimonas denitrificans DSM 1251]MDD3442680.1 bifunctional diguanylate cyclase/phosphodiesterase [Sulfurimonas denitrificans]
MVKKRELAIFFLLFVLGLFLAYTYNDITKAKETIFETIEKHEIEQISLVLQNIQKDIHTNYQIKDKDDLISVFKEQNNRERYEQILSIMLSSDVKYSYILYKDDTNKFRFLLDASKTDKANFNQKFDIDSKEYEIIYDLKEPQIIKQKNVENLYVTYLYPIISNGVVVGFFNIDFTTDIKMIILESIKPLEAFFTILTIFIFIFMGVTLIQIFHYFMTKKKIFTDPLTGTFNRNYLDEIEHVLNLEKYSVAMLDLDKFKIINDTYGHKTGDYVLSHVSTLFKNSIRESDILVRYGGEEFLLLINKRDKTEPKTNICERIRSNVAKENFSYDGHDIKVTVSIGVHKHPALEKNLQEAIKIADKMLYEAKSSGRNKIVIYDEKLNSLSLSSSSSKHLSFVKEALEEDRVTCYYQPIYNHHTGEIFKYEALVRIIAKDGKVIPPMSFMPHIKLTNMHYKLTQRVLSTVFEKFKDNKSLVSININFSDLINPDIEESIVKALKSNHHLASRVTFEILESDEIENIELFKQKIHLLHSLKAKVSIDDFGSGYSNFKSVIDIEANFLKIDGSLIKNIDVNGKDFKVVKSIVHFAAQSNMQTIAEFVHSKEVYEKLLLLDIDYMQGYYISKPEAHLILKDELFKTVS